MQKKRLPYRGLDSGIRRILEEWPNVNFYNDGMDTHLEIARKTRPEDLQVWILIFIKTNPRALYDDLIIAMNIEDTAFPSFYFSIGMKIFCPLAFFQEASVLVPVVMTAYI